MSGTNTLTDHQHIRQTDRTIQGWDDTFTIITLSIQKSTDADRYGHHAVPIQMMVTAAKTTTIPEPKLFVSQLTFRQLNKRFKHTEFDLKNVELILGE